MLLGFRTTVTLGAALGLMTACSSRSASSGGDYRNNREVALEVENHNYSDIVISLVRGSQSMRLGMVTGLSTAHFVLPYRRLGSSGDARLRAYPIGGPAAFTSENLYVQPGQWVKWTLESDLSRSFLGVY